MGALVRYLNSALERMMTFLGVDIHLITLGLGDITRKSAHHCCAFSVDDKHQTGGLLNVIGKEFLDDMDHKLHWRVVIVQQNDLEHRWSRQLRLGCRCGNAATSINA